MMKVPITKAVFDETDYAIIQKPLQSGWVVQGPHVKDFETRFSAFTKAKDSIAVSSCTTGLHIAMAALGIKPGDEVIVPSFTWVATANVVEYQGAKVVFCDVDTETFNLDVKQLEKKITSKTKAIIPVHLFGLSADMKPIMDLAKKYNLAVVEDAACGFGAYYNGVHVGNFGDFGVFSFHPRKAITTGEGGMITTQSEKYAELSRSLRDHGASRSDFARHNTKAAFLLSEFNIVGFNYRMTDIQGALGVTQMQKSKSIQERRAARAKRYDQALKDIPWLRLPVTPDNCVHGYQSYVCFFQPQKPTLQNVGALNELRNNIMVDLEEKGISTRQGTHAVTLLGYYSKKYGIKPEDYPGAYLSDRLTMTLPLYATMTDEEQDYVIDELKKVKI